MSLLSGFDLIRLEIKLKREVNDYFKWEKFGDCDVEPDWRAWNKMMGTGKNSKTISTRKCLDSKRRLEDYLHAGGSDGLGVGKGFMGSKSITGIRL